MVGPALGPCALTSAPLGVDLDSVHVGRHELAEAPGPGRAGQPGLHGHGHLGLHRNGHLGLPQGQGARAHQEEGREGRRNSHGRGGVGEGGGEGVGGVVGCGGGRWMDEQSRAGNSGRRWRGRGPRMRRIEAVRRGFELVWAWFGGVEAGYMYSVEATVTLAGQSAQLDSGHAIPLMRSPGWYLRALKSGFSQQWRDLSSSSLPPLTLRRMWQPSGQQDLRPRDARKGSW